MTASGPWADSRVTGKRIWRHAEAVNIRRPNTPFEQRF
jgi:uncharacterized protein YraI